MGMRWDVRRGSCRNGVRKGESGERIKEERDGVNRRKGGKEGKGEAKKKEKRWMEKRGEREN